MLCFELLKDKWLFKNTRILKWAEEISGRGNSIVQILVVCLGAVNFSSTLSSFVANEREFIMPVALVSGSVWGNEDCEEPQPAPTHHKPF